MAVRSKPKKLYKRLRICKACGNKFEVLHKLRLYCDGCKGKNI